MIKLIAKNEWINIWRNKTAAIMVAVFICILGLAAYIGAENTITQNNIRHKYQTEVKDQWMTQPDRHPHRVAHYGYLVFREKAPLSFFDFGIESFVGNSVFLEAHRQNSVNLSEAGFSNGLLRFGELSMAMVLQLLIPLFIFFIGFGTVASLKENGVLKILLSQGISVKTLLWGKIAGIFSFVMALFLTVVVIGFILMAGMEGFQFSTDLIMRSGVMILLYSLYFAVCSWAAVMVSAYAKKAGNALVILILLWMACGIVIPKGSQTIGTGLYPSISKLQFEKNIEEDLSKEGDSHDPDDPHFTAFKLATLEEYGVETVKDLPFNYSGYVMAEGERITSKLFNEHFERLINTYQNQNRVSDLLSFINPYLMVRNASMAIAGTDMASYIDFQRQSEAYRYNNSQWLNKIHTYQINAENDKAQRVSNELFQNKEVFEYRSRSLTWSLGHNVLLLIALIFWVLVAIGSVAVLSKKITVI